MSKAIKTVNAPVTEGFLLSDIRRTGSSFRANRMTTKGVLSLLTVAILVFSVLMTGLPTGARSVSANSRTRRSNMSPDLERAIVSSPGGTVRVIVDTKSSSNSSAFGRLATKIGAMGGVVFRSLNHNKSMSIQIPASAVAALAADNTVKYLSLDRKTVVTGHLETTSGAADARNYGTPDTGTIDGHGIGIAILDSGVYAAHHA